MSDEIPTTLTYLANNIYELSKLQSKLLTKNKSIIEATYDFNIKSVVGY